MTYLFSRANRHLLEIFAWSNVLLAFDYDGTLAPLVSTPARATMRPSTRRLLKRASTLYPCVAISGRGHADALSRLRGVEICRVVGNHGAEPSSGGEALRRRVQQWLPVLKARLSRRRGVMIEDKGFSVAIHYRQARKRNATRRTILAAAQSLEDVLTDDLVHASVSANGHRSSSRLFEANARQVHRALIDIAERPY